MIIVKIFSYEIYFHGLKDLLCNYYSYLYIQMSKSYHNLDMDQKKNIVITGANIGIGLQTAKGLYSDGHHIIFGSRNQQRNVAAAQQIIHSSPNSKGTVKWFKLDLSKRASIEEFTANVCKQFDRIDILINNAGMMMNDWQVNQSGVQMTMAVNHFGHFLLTFILFGNIKKSSEGRIINLSSSAHAHTSLATSQDLDSRESFGSLANYSKSKLANAQFTVALAERLTKYPNIKTVCLHPGIVDSDFATRMKCCTFIGCFKWICCCLYKSVESGARTSLFVSRQPFSKLQSGQYYDSDTSIGSMSSLARNRQHGQKLWLASEKLFNIQFKI